MELEQWSYSIPFEIKSDSEWKIDFAFDDAYSICYVFPKEGTGNAVVKLCVLDNWTDERRTGEMYITFPEDESKNQVIKLAQKCNLDNSTNPTDVSKGDRIYAVGYGYNYLGKYASARSVSRSPISTNATCCRTRILKKRTFFPLCSKPKISNRSARPKQILSNS